MNLSSVTGWTIADFMEQATFDEPVPNQLFYPSSKARAATHTFSGILHVQEFPIQLNLPDNVERQYLGKRIDRFPNGDLAFASSGSAFVPLNREIQRPLRGESFWDIILSPGCVWCEPDDNGWSRASFPFVLSNSMENEAHNGVGLFFFNDETTSAFRFQIVQQTSPYLLPKQFDAWGQVNMEYETVPSYDSRAIGNDYRTEQSAYIPTQPLSYLAEETKINDVKFDPGEETAIVYGLITSEKIYTSPQKVRHGDYPFPDQVRHGSWSMAKSAAATLTMLRLA